MKNDLAEKRYGTSLTHVCNYLWMDEYENKYVFNRITCDVDRTLTPCSTCWNSCGFPCPKHVDEMQNDYSYETYTDSNVPNKYRTLLQDAKTIYDNNLNWEVYLSTISSVYFASRNDAARKIQFFWLNKKINI